MREIDVFSPQAWDSRIMRESWQVYCRTIYKNKIGNLRKKGNLTQDFYKDLQSCTGVTRIAPYVPGRQRNLFSQIHFENASVDKNEWMNEFLYTAHITKSHGGLHFCRVRSDVSMWRRLWQPLSVHIRSHPPTHLTQAWVWKIEGQTTTPGTTSPTLANSVWVL